MIILYDRVVSFEEATLNFFSKQTDFPYIKKGLQILQTFFM